MNAFQFSTKGLHALRAEYLRDIDEARSNEERFGPSVARTQRIAKVREKLAEVDAELAARATATHPMSTPAERAEFGAAVRARVEVAPSVTVSVEDASVCPSCDRVVAHPEDHSARCTVQR